MEVNFKKMSNVLVVGLTKEAALKQADYLTEKYKEYGIELVHPPTRRNRDFTNGEYMYVLSYDELKNAGRGLKLNACYYDKDIPQDDLFEEVMWRLIRPPRSLWQF